MEIPFLNLLDVLECINQLILAYLDVPLAPLSRIKFIEMGIIKMIWVANRQGLTNVRFGNPHAVYNMTYGEDFWSNPD